MADLCKRLSGEFNGDKCYEKFGAVLRKMEVHGFRGIENLEINFDFPITVITGLNGAGKSTLGQLAVCGYKKPQKPKGYKRQYVKDFFPVSAADPLPISKDASVVFHYDSPGGGRRQEVTVTRAKSSWSGYKRQPERISHYVGFMVYVPKVERRDMSVYGSYRLTITDKRGVDESVVLKMARVIGQDYSDINFQGIALRKKTSEIGMAERFGQKYSENHMGFGEGRVLYIMDKLENSPDQSLFVIEEPETALHVSAQHEFAKYLLDVCLRKKHQIIISTHSSEIVSVLPAEARKLVVRDSSGVKISEAISAGQVRSILSSGYDKTLTVCVEDPFAKTLLTEAFRRYAPDLLGLSEVFDIGDTKAVSKAVSMLRGMGRQALGVRDADTGEDRKQNLYSFPGTLPPEKEVFSCDNVLEKVKEKYSVDFLWLVKQKGDVDHHDYTKILAKYLHLEEAYIRQVVIEYYLDQVGNEFAKLANDIKRIVT